MLQQVWRGQSAKFKPPTLYRPDNFWHVLTLIVRLFAGKRNQETQTSSPILRSEFSLLSPPQYLPDILEVDVPSWAPSIQDCMLFNAGQHSGIWWWISLLRLQAHDVCAANSFWEQSCLWLIMILSHACPVGDSTKHSDISKSCTIL